MIKRILVTNDDGIDAPGLAVAEALAHDLADEVWTFAPAGNRSGTAQALSSHAELSVSQHGPRRYAVTGTPADCVMAALGGPWLRGAVFDLVLSGVNWGGNLSDSVMYSGTVGAALAAAHFGLPAMALSQAFDGPSEPDFTVARDWARAAIDTLWWLDAEAGVAGCWNINFPFGRSDDIAGLRFTRQVGGIITAPRFTREAGRSAYRLSFSRDTEAVSDPSADVSAIRARYVSAMPLTRSRCDDVRLADLGVGQNVVLSETAVSPRT